MPIFTFIIAGFLYSQSISSNNYIQIGNEFQQSANWDSANYYYYLALPELIQKNEFEELVHTYRSIGNDYIRLGKNDSALYYISLSINTAKSKLNEPDIALMKAYNSQASIYGSQGDYLKSADYFKLALHHHLLSHSDKKSLTAKLYNNIGTIYNFIGEMDSAIVYLEQALKLKSEIYTTEDKNLSSTYNNLGILYFNRGYYSDAITILKLALKTDGIEDNTPDLIKIYHNLGMVSKAKGDLDMAESYLLKELYLYNESINVNRTHLALNYNSLGNLYNKMGKFNTALVQYKSSLKLLENHDPENYVHIALVLNNMGNIHLNLEEYINAESAFSKSLHYYEKLDFNDPKKGLLYSNMGKMYRKQSNYNMALQYYHQSLNYYSLIYEKTHPSILENYIDIGLTLLDQKEIDSSLFYFDEASVMLHIPAAIELDDASQQIKHKDMGLSLIHHQTTAILKKTEIPISTEKEINLLNQILLKCEMSVRLIQDIRKSFLFTQSKYLLSETMQDIYAKGIHSAYRLFELTGQKKYRVSALRFSEYSRASIFRESLAASENIRYSNIPEEIFHKIERMKADISYFQNEINLEEGKPAPEINSKYLAQLQDSRFKMMSRYDEFMQSIKRDYPDFYNLLNPEREFKLEAVYNRLIFDEVIIEYFQGESEIYIFCISNFNLTLKKIPLTSEFDQLVNDFITSIKKINHSQFYDSGLKLYDILLLPVSKEINTKNKITFILGGTVSTLPFEALPIPLSQINSKSTGNQFLLEQFEISYSLTAERIERKTPDPEIDFTQIAVFAPVNNFTANFENNAPFMELNYTLNEAQSIASMGEEFNIETNLFLESHATEENFKNEIQKKYNIFHIATHGYLNEFSPDLSALYFSNHENQKEDGILFSTELYNLNILADLTVLSGCETGLGKMVNGEGILSLSRGFSYAGSKNIIYTLWKVSDKASFTLMEHFYEQLFKEKNYSKALRNAKLLMISKEETSLPRFWSGYVLMEN